MQFMWNNFLKIPNNPARAYTLPLGHSQLHGGSVGNPTCSCMSPRPSITFLNFMSVILLLLFIMPLLRYTSHATQFTHLKCSLLGFAIFVELCNYHP